MFKYEILKDGEIDIKSIINWLKNKNIEFKEYSEKLEIYFNEYYLLFSFDKFIKSIKAGFSIKDSENILYNNFDIIELDLRKIFKEKINHRKRVIGRIIGENGTILNKISEITKCKIIIKNDRYIYLLGDNYSIDAAINMINKIMEGSKHNTAIEFGMEYMKYLDKKKKEEKQYL